MKLLCTDLDRTLLPNGEHAESRYARPILWHLLRTHDVQLAYVSGRDFTRVLDAIEKYDLPDPDVIVSDVGSSIYTTVAGIWKKNANWTDSVSLDWSGASAKDIQRCLSEFDFLQVQGHSRQAAHKLSYYFPESADQEMLHQSINTVLVRNAIDAALVFSHDPEKKRGLLDVLPKSATKSHAVAYLQSLFGLPADELMFAGDSGNDICAICAGNPSVLVANADIDTRESVLQRMAAAEELVESVYFARGNIKVAGLDALNGCYAAGIVEALVHFRPQWNELLHDAQWIEQALSQFRA